VTVTVAFPVVAVAEAVKVSVLVPVVEVGLNTAVTPDGVPLALRATLPVNPFVGTTVIVLDADTPACTIVTLAGLRDNEKSGMLLTTVRLIEVVRVSMPLVPVTGTVAVLTVAVGEAVNVKVLVPVVGFGVNVAVTPAGKPPMLKATLPVKPPLRVAVIVLVAVPPCRTETLPGFANSAKFGGLLTTVSAIGVVWMSEPLVPVIVTVAGPTAAVTEAVNVTTLVPVVEAGLNTAVTPVGKPLAVKATVPVNPFRVATVMVLVAVPPCKTETLAGMAKSEKFGGWTAVTFKLMIAVRVRLRAAFMPAMVTLTVPVAAVAEAVNVSVLVPVVDAGLKAAVTPDGRAPTLSATLLLNPPKGVTVMVLIPVPPWATVAFVPDSEKSGFDT